MSDVLGVPVESIHEQSSPKTIASWDSLRQMNLVVALEEEFSLRFDDEVFPSLTSFVAIREALEKAHAGR